jgi:lipopolysaccharide exporter
MPNSLQNKMAKGAMWMVLFKFVDRGLGLISTLILARLLGPADFGVVGMALSFIFMAELLTAFGFDYALIQKKDATTEHYNTAWTCNLLLGLTIMLLMLASAAAVADFYRHPEVYWVVCALAVGPLISGAENIGVVAFRKELDFRREFKFQVSRKIIGFSIVVPTALLLRSYWALVIGILFAKLAGTVISYFMHPYRPRLSLARVGEMMAFSRWILVNNLLGFFKERSSDFFIGRAFGPAALGSYNVAYELSNLPTTEISAPINRALMPGFARMESSAEISDAYAVAVGMLALTALPAAAAIMVLAPFLVPLILGSKWLGVVPLMQVLAFNGALLLFHSSITAVLIGRGQPGRTTFANGCYVAVLMTMLAIVWLFWRDIGVLSAAYAALATSALCTPVYLWQIRSALGVSPLVFVRAIARPLLAAGVMALVVRWALPEHDLAMGVARTLGWLAGGGVLAVLVYVATAWAAWQVAGCPAGAERTLLAGARSFWLRIRQRWAPPGAPG